jgi:hypothetical protein
MIDISRALKCLGDKRAIFHSEADLQHALAWEIQQLWQKCDIRLEFKPPHLDNRIYLDIWVKYHGTIFAIELKYKTRHLHIQVGEETFDLLDQSAQDLGRYDFLKDIQRLEQIALNHNNMVGYAIFLTNDSAYWTPPKNNQTVDVNFRIHQDRNLNGKLQWSGASEGTMHGRKEAIFIKGIYNLKWQDYSELSAKSYGKLKYLLVKVGSGCNI